MDDRPIVDLLPSLSWGEVGATGLLVLAVVLLLTGRIVPRSMVGHIQEQRDKRMRELREEADSWKRAFVVSQEENNELREQLAISQEQGETIVGLLLAIRDGGGGSGPTSNS